MKRTMLPTRHPNRRTVSGPGKKKQGGGVVSHKIEPPPQRMPATPMISGGSDDLVEPIATTQDPVPEAPAKAPARPGPRFENKPTAEPRAATKSPPTLHQLTFHPDRAEIRLTHYSNV